MGRSEINHIIHDMENLIQKQGYALPVWAGWAPEKWRTEEHTEEIVENKLGWDVTDFGLEKYRECGFALFTIRNGNIALKEKYPKPYA